MKRLSGLFRSKQPKVDRRAPVTDAILADLEAEAKAAESGFRWVPLNRAGDLCERASNRAQALYYYGLAIDAMLEDGQSEPARGLATKIVRIHPAAVRTLCTLTWLDLAAHHMASVVVHLNEYVARAQKADCQELAGEQVYMMAHVAADAEFRAAVADALDALECMDDAARVRLWAEAGQAPHDEESPDDWGDLCLSHALGSHALQIDNSEEEVGNADENDQESENDQEGSTQESETARA